MFEFCMNMSMCPNSPFSSGLSGSCSTVEICSRKADLSSVTSFWDWRFFSQEPLLCHGCVSRCLLYGTRQARYHGDLAVFFGLGGASTVLFGWDHDIAVVRGMFRTGLVKYFIA